MYWMTKQKIHLRQLAQHADTLMRLGGTTPSSLTRATTPRSRRDDDYNNRQQVKVAKHFLHNATECTP